MGYRVSNISFVDLRNSAYLKCALTECIRILLKYQISTGLVCDADAANEVHKFIRTVLAKMYDDEVAQSTRIQYGGSVTPESVDGLMAMSDIDGCLVGGASLFADKFARIVNFD